MADKVIVTNAAALVRKYGSKGFAAIRKSVSRLVAADKKRGVATAMICLDSAKAMKKLGVKPVGNVSDFRENKIAIDGVFKGLRPDYLMILGSIDVVPHQDLTNPAFKAGNDDDAKAFGDLPYACDTIYGRDIAQFVGPTRVVGRLPDLTGAKEPSHLLALLKTAASWRSRPAGAYSTFFGLSAAIWQGSTKLSLDNIFGNCSGLMLAPPRGPKYPNGEIHAQMHFINCHGGSADPKFYGQKGKSYPVSLSTKATAGAIREGTVAAVECCYGAQLYNSVTLGLDMPICQSYLKQGAYGYFGSTTIAFGEANDNSAADLLCQYFLLNVLGGASIGRAALMARQMFVDQTGQMDPIDLKTLAQFCLYGDPSVHPAAVPGETKLPIGADREATARFRRRERRTKLKQTGDFLQKMKPTASRRQTRGRIPIKAKSALANIAEGGGLPRTQAFVAFKVKGVKRARGDAAKLASTPSRYFLTIGTPESKATQTIGRRVAVIAKEVAGRIIDYRIYHER